MRKFSMVALFAAVSACVLPAGSAQAQFTVFCANCDDLSLGYSTLQQQITAVFQSAQQLQTQIQQTQMMVQNTANAPSMIYNALTSEFGQLMSVYNMSQSLLAQSGNLDSQFAQKYPDYATWASTTSPSTPLAANYPAWSQNLRSSAQTSLDVAGLQMAQMHDQQARITAIQGMASSASGQMQALQAGNMMAGAIADELGKLHAATVEHMRLDAEYIAQQGTEKAAVAVSEQTRLGTMPVVVGKTW